MHHIRLIVRWRVNGASHRNEGITMAEETKVTEVAQELATTDSTLKTRRTFVKTAAQVAVTAPAVGLLLNARPAAAQINPYNAQANHILDDFTFGSNEEDVDANKGNGAAGPGGYCAPGKNGNFNPFNGIANQDDVCVIPPA